GSTARSESLDVEDVKELVAPYHARVRAELERHGGTFEKFSGDAILALFGAPRAHEDDPERAIRAGLAVRTALAELNAEDDWLDLHFRIGINTGEALVMLDARAGGDAELGQLLGFARETFDAGQPAIATVLGSPGIGKSRLLAELVSQLEGRCAIYRGRCLSYGEGITYWPVNEILKGAAGILH